MIWIFLNNYAYLHFVITLSQDCSNINKNIFKEYKLEWLYKYVNLASYKIYKFFQSRADFLGYLFQCSIQICFTFSFFFLLRLLSCTRISVWALCIVARSATTCLRGKLVHPGSPGVLGRSELGIIFMICLLWISNRNWSGNICGSQGPFLKKILIDFFCTKKRMSKVSSLGKLWDFFSLKWSW